MMISFDARITKTNKETHYDSVEMGEGYVVTLTKHSQIPKAYSVVHPGSAVVLGYDKACPATTIITYERVR